MESVSHRPLHSLESVSNKHPLFRHADFLDRNLAQEMLDSAVLQLFFFQLQPLMALHAALVFPPRQAVDASLQAFLFHLHPWIWWQSSHFFASLQDVGLWVGTIAGPMTGEETGGPLGSSLSQKQVQVSGNSSVTTRHAPAMSYPSWLATHAIRSPQACPSTTVCHASSVHLEHPHLLAATVGGAIGCIVGFTVGCWTGPVLGLVKISLSS
mmetsp:Transcript_10407/g.20524  ORF Transcript_10407/g.20524 Transcript_10407/m.20524 type:complete len:211 (+) Transcript_10407:147-779(+)